MGVPPFSVHHCHAGTQWQAVVEANSSSVLRVGADRDRLARQKDAVLSPARAKKPYIEGQNLTIEYRFAEEQYERLPELALGVMSR
jgi:hypothetical protein